MRIEEEETTKFLKKKLFFTFTSLDVSSRSVLSAEIKQSFFKEIHLLTVIFSKGSLKMGFSICYLCALLLIQFLPTESLVSILLRSCFLKQMSFFHTFSHTFH